MRTYKITHSFLLFLFLIINLTAATHNITAAQPSPPQIATFPPAKTVHDVFQWINRNIRYNFNADAYVWQSPAVTLATRSGMCVDIAGLALLWLEQRFSLKGYIILISYPNRELGHALLIFRDLPNIAIEPSTGLSVEPVFEIDALLTLENYLSLIEKGETL